MIGIRHQQVDRAPCYLNGLRSLCVPAQARASTPASQGSEFKVFAFPREREAGIISSHRIAPSVLPGVLLSDGRCRFFRSGDDEASFGRLGVAVAALHDGRWVAGGSLD